MEISPAEKLILLMLCDLHKALKVQGDIDPVLVQSVLASDQTWALPTEYQALGPTEWPDDVKETAEILEMWWTMETSYAGLSPADKATVKAANGGRDVQFPGFDGNGEPHFGIALTFTDDLNRFTQFKGRNLNAHMPTLARYRKMLSLFDSLWTPPKALSVSDLLALI